MSNKGQAAVFLAILALVVGVVAFIGIYGMNARQHQALADTVAQSIEAVEVEDLYVETVGHAVARHGPIVYSVLDFCKNNPNNIQTQMHWDSPKGPRDAQICFFPDDGKWWVVILGKEINGDDVVTVFDRATAKSLQDVINYLKTLGYR